MNSEILQPVVALALWTMVMWLWMYATRIPAMSKLEGAGDPSKAVGLTGAHLDAVLPAQVQWKAHNYNHLMAEPTVFYAVALSLALLGAGDGFNATLAWVYVALRVIHSVFQATINRVIVRFGLFALSSITLIWLTINAALAAFA